jgi:predicted ATPase/DNA-binding SARP family transcriptional activator
LRNRKGRDILKLLSLASNHRLHREQLVDILWPEVHPEKGINSLYNALYLLRQVISGLGFNPSELICFDEENLHLCSGSAIWIDLEAFDIAAEHAFLNRDMASCLRALSLGNGELLPENPYDDWVIPHRESFDLKVLKLKRVRAELLEAQNEWDSAAQVYTQILAKDALDEDAHANLMRVYAQLGQRGAALLQFQSLQKVLKQELGTVPATQTSLLHQAILENRYPEQSVVDLLPQKLAGNLTSPSPDSAVPGHRLKRTHDSIPIPLTSFIGREKEISEILHLLVDHRLVSLTGAGGVGKTRLALEVSRRVLDAPGSGTPEVNISDYSDGVWYLELAKLTNPELVLPELANLFDISYYQSRNLLENLVDFLQYRRLLLVFDNCEHVIQECASISASLLTCCGNVRILATSREVLGVDGERVYPLPSLTFADPNHLPPIDQFLHMEAPRLFAERARLVLPGFQVTPHNAQSVAEICSTLDGIPLSLEMTAARLRVLSLDQIRERIQDAFRLLDRGSAVSLPHHQTLRASLDWSYSFLSEKEKLLLQRLSVFAESCDLAAVESICAGEGLKECEILGLMEGLIEKSLLFTRQATSGRLRYHMLQIVQQYALENLRASQSEEMVRAQHLDYFLKLAETSRNKIWTGERLTCIERLTEELQNLRSAISWAYGYPERCEKGIRLSEAISRRYMQFKGFFSEARTWLIQGLRIEGTPPLPDLLRARTLGTLAWLEYLDGNVSGACQWSESCEKISRTLGEAGQGELSWSLFIQGDFSSDLEAGLQFAEESVRIARQIQGEERWYLPNSIHRYAMLFLHSDEARARELLQEEIQLHLELGDRWSSAGGYFGLGFIHFLKKEYDLVESEWNQALALFKEGGDKFAILFTMCWLAWLNLDSGDHRRFFMTSQEILETFTPPADLYWYLITFLAIGTAFVVLEGEKDSTQLEDLLTAAILISFTEHLEVYIQSELEFDFKHQFFDKSKSILERKINPDRLLETWQKGRSIKLNEALTFALSLKLSD